MSSGIYFAYGSNINLDQMERRCPDAVPLRPVTLYGYELTFRGGGVATIMPKEGGKVPGLLWRITPECEQSLDHYEGFPSLYGKESVVVKDGRNTGYRAMVYVMTPRYARVPAEPSKGYFDGIRQGYLQNGIPTEPLTSALKRVREEARVYDEQQPWRGFTPWTPKAPARKPKHKNMHR